MREEDLMIRMALDMVCRILEEDTKAIDRIWATVLTMGPHQTTYFVTALTQGVGFFANCMKKDSRKNRQTIRCLIRAIREGSSDSGNACNGQYYDNPDSEK